MKSISLYVLLGILLQIYLTSALCSTRGNPCSVTLHCCRHLYCDESLQCKDCIKAGNPTGHGKQSCCSGRIGNNYKCCNGFGGECEFHDHCCSNACRYPGKGKDRVCT